MAVQNEIFRLDNEGLKCFCLHAFNTARQCTLMFGFVGDVAAQEILGLAALCMRGVGLKEDSFPTLEELETTIDTLKEDGFITVGTSIYFPSLEKLVITDEGQVALEGMKPLRSLIGPA